MSDYSELKRLSEACLAEEQKCPHELLTVQEARAYNLLLSDFEDKANPSTVLALIAENERLNGLQPSLPPRPNEGDGLPRFGLRWNGPSNPLAVSMEDGYWTPWHLADQLKAENEALKAEVDELTKSTGAAMFLTLTTELAELRKGRTDWQAECLKRGFEYVRESDDHYVLADLPEMADLLGMLLGVEVRTKDNDAYEEANSRLNEQVEGLINTIHAQETLRQDAERYRFLRRTDCWEDATRGGPWIVNSRDETQNQDGVALDAAVDAAMAKEVKP